MRKLFWIFLFFPLSGLAKVDIAFIEMKNYAGQVIRLEPNGRFAHIAISYRGKWLHAHPSRGVEIVSKEELGRIGTVREVVSLPDVPEIRESEAKRYLGKPYDGRYSWSDEAIYSSELVAKLLGIEPKPMDFRAKIWPPEFQALRGQPGLSPDDLYEELSRTGERSRIRTRACSRVYGGGP